MTLPRTSQTGPAGAEIRTAGFHELDAHTAYLLWQLRERVFVVEQACPYPELDGRDLEPGTRHVWVPDGGRPVAYLRVLEEGGSRPVCRIGRVAVDADHRGRGLADRLMTTAMGIVGDRDCVLDAQSYLVGWYRRMGFEPSGPEFLDDGIPHVPMRRAGAARPATAEGAAQSSRSRP